MYFALPYQESFLTRKLIYQFKYEPHIKQLAAPLASLMEEHFGLIQKTPFTSKSLLVPIPIERTRLKSRGYNQTEELAKELVKKFSVPAALNNLVKVKRTKPQVKLSAKERQENLRGAFAVQNPEEISGKEIFLVDDVYTTGATMEECARVLLKAGAKAVWGIAIAREG